MFNEVRINFDLMVTSTRSTFSNLCYRKFNSFEIYMETFNSLLLDVPKSLKMFVVPFSLVCIQQKSVYLPTLHRECIISGLFSLFPKNSTLTKFSFLILLESAAQSSILSNLILCYINSYTIYLETSSNCMKTMWMKWSCHW